MAKGLGGGYEPISAVMASEKVIKGIGKFENGHTFEGMPITIIAALEVQKIIKKDKLLKKVSKQGAYLEKGLKIALMDHPNVGNIRGQGLF